MTRTAANGAAIRAVLLDLDGTLLDTAGDLTDALNRVRAEHGLPPLSFETVRPCVSHGAAAIVRCGFPNVSEAEFDIVRARLLAVYADALANRTRLFDGFDSTLAALEARGLLWGIVTNKPAFLAEPLVRQLDLAQRCACIVSGDTLPRRKPHPDPLFHAAEMIKLAPAQCLYVGDAERDIQAGRAAGMKTLVAKFGYLSEQDQPELWKADGMIDTPQQILEWV